MGEAAIIKAVILIWMGCWLIPKSFHIKFARNKKEWAVRRPHPCEFDHTMWFPFPPASPGVIAHGASMADGPCSPPRWAANTDGRRFSGGTSRDTMIEWVCRPVCGGKTRIRIRPDAGLINFPLYCPTYKRERLIHAKGFRINAIIEPDV